VGVPHRLHQVAHVLLLGTVKCQEGLPLRGSKARDRGAAAGAKEGLEEVEGPGAGLGVPVGKSQPAVHVCERGRQVFACMCETVCV
jgi:hypothetical protein